LEGVGSDNSLSQTSQPLQVSTTWRQSKELGGPYKECCTELLQREVLRRPAPFSISSLSDWTLHQIARSWKDAGEDTLCPAAGAAATPWGQPHGLGLQRLGCTAAPHPVASSLLIVPEPVSLPGAVTRVTGAPGSLKNPLLCQKPKGPSKSTRVNAWCTVRVPKMALSPAPCQM
jgi:hypothetical protein